MQRTMQRQPRRLVFLLVSLALMLFPYAVMAGRGAAPTTSPAQPAPAQPESGPIKPAPEVREVAPATPAPATPTPAPATPAPDPTPPARSPEPREESPPPQQEAPQSDDGGSWGRRESEPAPPVKETPAPPVAQPVETPRATPRREPKAAPVLRPPKDAGARTPRQGAPVQTPTAPATPPALTPPTLTPPRTVETPRAGVPVPMPAPPETESPVGRGATPVTQPTPPPVVRPGETRQAVPVTMPRPPRRDDHDTTTPVPPPPLRCWGRERVPEVFYSDYDEWLGICRGAPDCIATVYFLEEYEISGQEEPEQVEYCIAPDFARITHANGEVLMDVQRDLLAHYDRENKEWRLQSLQAFESKIDSTTAILMARLEEQRGSRGLPVFEKAGAGPRIVNMPTDRYHLYVEVEPFPGELEEVEEEIWVASRELLAWSATYPTYERIVRLYDQMWRDVPVERPDGVVVHTTIRRRPVPRRAWNSENQWEVEKATIVEVEYRCMPYGFFQLPPEVEVQAGGTGPRLD